MSEIAPVVPTDAYQRFPGGDWAKWYVREAEDSAPGNGPAANGSAYLTEPGENYGSTGYTNDENNDHATAQSTISTGESYNVAICKGFYTVLDDTLGHASISFRYAKLLTPATMSAHTVEIYFQPVGTTPSGATRVYQNTNLPGSSSPKYYNASVDLTSYITSTSRYSIWIVALHTCSSGSGISSYSWFEPPVVEMRNDQPTYDLAIKTGSPATAWASLTETTLENPSALSLDIDYRSNCVFEWEAHTGEMWGGLTHQRVQFEYDSEVRFRGRINEVEGVGDPGDQRHRIRCIDARGLSRNVIVVDDPGTNDFPERIYNCEESDPDRFRSKANGQEIGEIIKDLFDDHITQLYAEDAVPSAVAADAYTQSELDKLDHIPGKQHFREMNFEAAITKLVAEQGSAWSLFVDPSDQTWHFVDRTDTITDCPAATVTLGSDDVIRPKINHSIDGCYTALEIYGRRGAGKDTAKTKIGVTGSKDFSSGTYEFSGLEAAWDSGYEAAWTPEKSVGERDYGTTTGGSLSDPYYLDDSSKDWTVDYWIDGVVIFPEYSETTEYSISDSTATRITFTLGSNPVPTVSVGDRYILRLQTEYCDVFRKFKITDAAKRDVLSGGEYAGEDCCPRLFYYFHATGSGTSGKTLVPIRIEPDDTDGVHILAQYPIYKKTAGVYDLKDDITFEYCYRDTSTTGLYARYPDEDESSGDLYTGTAYTVHGLQRVKRIIASEFDADNLKTTFEGLATELLKPYQNIRHWGNVPIDGLDWSYAGLRKSLNIAHTSESIGWEDIDASLIGVRFDLANKETSLQISNDYRDGFNYQARLNTMLREANFNADGSHTNDQDDYIFCAKGGKLGMPERADDVDDVFDYQEMPNPDEWGKFLGTSSSKRTNCDQTTYTSAGTWNDPNAADGCTQIGDLRLFNCSMDAHPGGHGYKSPYSPYSSVDIHGVVLRSGSGLNGDTPANTHFLYPYYCETGGYPSTTWGQCRDSNDAKDIVLVVPESVSSTQTRMDEFLISFLVAYANFVTFTSQGFSCTDDRLFILDQNIWGPMDKGAKTGCGSQGEAKTLVDAICHMMSTWTEYASLVMSNLHQDLNGAAAAGTYITSGGESVVIDALDVQDLPPSVTCEMKLECCPTCGAGRAVNQDGAVGGCCRMAY